MKNEKRIESYSDFWDFYVSEHTNPLNRQLHFFGTTFAIVLLVWFSLNQMWIYLPLCLVFGYGFSWIGHFFVEKNKPASFTYPAWSFVSDYVMLFYMITGKMNSEVRRVASEK
jgi:hypothetical protein